MIDGPEGDRPANPALASQLRGRYEIRSAIGSGGMAIVYVAHDLVRDRTVALKVLRPEVASFDASERFLREIRMVARLVHPHILPLLDSGDADGQLWFTMPFIEGESLRAYLDRSGQLPVGTAIRLTSEIASALGYAHAKGILHRDIKPENILLADGHALVADFGIARAIANDAGDQLTATGMSVGTPAYMSPEQSTGERHIDARTDIYALGAVCYEMLAGEPPFTGPNAQAVIARRLSQPPPSLRTTRPGIADAIDAAVQRALAPAPADRFESAPAFAAALAAAAEAPARAQPHSRASRKKTARVVGALSLAALAAVAAGGAYQRLSHTASFASSTTAATPAATRSGVRLAVLPFTVIGGDSADRYLADGLSEEIDAELADLSGLRVIARRSVEAVAASTMRPRAIGEALDADALVTGDVQRAGTELRVRVHLIDAKTEETRWSQPFDAAAHDVLLIQSRVASKVAALLRIQLAERESRSLGRPLTTNPAAYDLYLRARTLAAQENDGSRARYDTTIAELTRAVALDSTFGAAWAVRAYERADAAFYVDAGAAALDSSESDVRHALALDSMLVVAWLAKTSIAWSAERGWNFPEAVAASVRAIQVRPSDVAAHETLGSLLLHYGFLHEAGEEFATSLSLDPRDGCNTTRCVGFSQPREARVFWYRQQFDSALAVYQRFPPHDARWAWEHAVVLGALGRAEEGLAVLDSTRGAEATETYDRQAARGLLYAMLGRRADALAQIRLASSHSTGHAHFHHAEFTIACAYARLGDARAAVEWLRRTAADGMPNYPLFRDDPNLRALHGDAAYEALMRSLAQQFERNTRLLGSLRAGRLK